MKQLFLIFLLTLVLSAKSITPNEVYSQVMRIEEDIHFLLDYYNIEHNHNNVSDITIIKTPLKPRNVWQLTYEIMIKINMLRSSHKLPIIEPINIEPMLNLNANLVYEQTQRILTELKIFKVRMGIESTDIETKLYYNKTPLDVFNTLRKISASFDKLNQSGFTPSYVFGETMRVYDDLTTILSHLRIKDNTIPTARDDKATPLDTFSATMKILDKIKQIQFSVGITTVDFSVFIKTNPTPSDVFTMTQMIIAELQTIKAYIGLTHYVTPAATIHLGKTPADVDQLMSWNLRKILLIDLASRRIR